MKSVSTFRYVKLFSIVTFLIFNYYLSRAGILYVNISASGTNDGTSWTNAYRDLQPAIDAAITGDEIWVAAGTYLPTTTHGDTSSLFKTFFIDKGIKIFGGFDGVAGTEGQFDNRDVVAHPVILSGNLGLIDSTNDNSLHVIWLDHVGADMVLDGFTIRDGFGSYAGGLYNDGSLSGSSNPTIANCIFENNTTMNAGGAVENEGSEGEAKPVFINCLFKNNIASGGGAMVNLANPAGNASPVLINCQFKGNSGPTAGGGAIENIALSDGISSPQLYNCLFSGNSSLTSGVFHSFGNANGTCSPLLVNCTFAGNFGGAISSSIIGGSTGNPVIKNSIFWGNSGGSGISDNGSTTTVTFSVVPFGAIPGEGNIGLDPMFVNLPDFNTAPSVEGDLHLTAGSPAINAGDNSAVPANITTDLEGLPRIHPENGGVGVVDMGAFEFQGEITAVSDINISNEWNITPNPASDVINISLTPTHSAGWLRMYDLQGHEWTNMFLEANKSDSSFSVGNIPTGVYLVQLIFNGRYTTRKLVVQ